MIHSHVQLLTAIFFERRIGLENNKQSLNEKSRSLMRAKRRKTNIVLNTLIAIVLLLIVVVTVNIFFKDDKTASKESDKIENSVEKENSETASALSQRDQEKEDIDTQEKVRTSKDNEKEQDKDKKEELGNEDDIKDQEVVTEGGSDPEVKKTIVNPAWAPVGTSQTGQHFNEYSGVDWDEMVQAISYGTGIDPGNMTVVFLGNNGPDKSVGTIKQKDTQQVFRVYIEWVDEKGWKPTQVEELAN